MTPNRLHFWSEVLAIESERAVCIHYDVTDNVRATTNPVHIYAQVVETICYRLSKIQKIWHWSCEVKAESTEHSKLYIWVSTYTGFGQECWFSSWRLCLHNEVIPQWISTNESLLIVRCSSPVADHDCLSVGTSLKVNNDLRIPATCTNASSWIRMVRRITTSVHS